MAKFNYVKMRALAQKLIDKFGGDAQFIKDGQSGGFDPDTGSQTPDTPPIVIDGISTPLLSYKSSEIDGTVIKIGDGYIFFHSDIEPEIDMKITLNGDVFRAINLTKLTSVQGVKVICKVQLRR